MYVSLIRSEILNRSKYASLHKLIYSLLDFGVWRNELFGETITMKQLNRDLIINYITTKQDKYKERRDAARAEGRLSESNNYEIRILPLTNLLNRIMRGEFDVKRAKDRLSEVKDED